MNLSNEHRLLLHCSRLKMNDTTKSEIHRLVFLQLDWKVFLESARWHGVAPMVFNNLKNIPERHQIPDEIIENLKSDYRKNLIRNTIIFAELDRVLAAFEENIIEVIPKNLSVEETVEKILDFGGIPIVPHLFRNMSGIKKTKLIQLMELREIHIFWLQILL